jgi:hypothetical protein
MGQKGRTMHRHLILPLLLAVSGAHRASALDDPSGACAGDKGDNHVNFRVADVSDVAADKDNNHVNFRVATDGDHAILADLVPGVRGVEVCADSVGGTALRVVVRPDGVVEVNGRAQGACDPADTCRLAVAWACGTGSATVQVSDGLGVILAGQWELPLAPSEIRIAAAEVLFLSVRP